MTNPTDYPRRPGVGFSTAKPRRRVCIRQAGGGQQNDIDPGQIRSKLAGDEAGIPTRDGGGVAIRVTKKVGDASQVKFNVRVTAPAKHQQ